MSNSVRPHRRQPTRLPCPWDSPGKNTGVGCHFLLQCMKVKSESEVTQSCPTLSDPLDCSPPGSSVHGIFQARVLEWAAIAGTINLKGFEELLYLQTRQKTEVLKEDAWHLVQERADKRWWAGCSSCQKVLPGLIHGVMTSEASDVMCTDSEVLGRKPSSLGVPEVTSSYLQPCP